MLLVIFLFISIILQTLQLITMWWPKKKESIYYYGPKPTKAERAKARKRILELVAEFPDGQFSKDYPEYLQELIDSVDLSELDEALKK